MTPADAPGFVGATWIVLLSVVLTFALITAGAVGVWHTTRDGAAARRAARKVTASPHGRLSPGLSTTLDTAVVGGRAVYEMGAPARIRPPSISDWSFARDGGPHDGRHDLELWPATAGELAAARRVCARPNDLLAWSWLVDTCGSLPRASVIVDQVRAGSQVGVGR
jgi:hypothetical protein